MGFGSCSTRPWIRSTVMKSAPRKRHTLTLPSDSVASMTPSFQAGAWGHPLRPVSGAGHPRAVASAAGSGLVPASMQRNALGGTVLCARLRRERFETASWANRSFRDSGLRRHIELAPEQIEFVADRNSPLDTVLEARGEVRPLVADKVNGILAGIRAGHEHLGTPEKVRVAVDGADGVDARAEYLPAVADGIEGLRRARPVDGPQDAVPPRGDIEGSTKV